MNEPRLIRISEPSVGEEEWQALREPLTSGWLMQGPKVAEFERQFSIRHQVKHALATTSCTTALHLILAAMEIGPGDEVVLPAFTWVATANAVVYCGATPVFADIDPATYNLDPKKVAARITRRTKAIIAVHLFGLCADIDAVARAAPGIPIVEDAACAAGSSYFDRPAGSLGVAAAFSFHPRKSITTGEGGMVTTNDDALAERVGMLRNHGAAVPIKQRHGGSAPHVLPEINLLGYNYRMTDLQGAVGLVQLKKLDDLIAQRQRWAGFYCKELADVSWLRLPLVTSGYSHGWQSFVCYVDEQRSPFPRNEVMEKLQVAGVSTRPGTHAVHMLGYYQKHFGFRADDFPATRDCDRHAMAIPLHNRMSDRDYRQVIGAIKTLG